MRYHPFAYLFFHDARRLGEAVQKTLGDRFIVIYPQPHNYDGKSPTAFFERYPLRFEVNDGSYRLLKKVVSIDPLSLRSTIPSAGFCRFVSEIVQYCTETGEDR